MTSEALKRALNYGKSEQAKELRKKWISLVSRKDFSLTIGHRVCSAHFPGGKKTYMNKLPTIVPKTIKPTPMNPRPTIKSRNRTPLASNTNKLKVSRCRLSLEIHSVQDDISTVTLDEQSQTNQNTATTNSTLQEQVAELLSMNAKLKAENKRLKKENTMQKAEIKIMNEQLQQQVKENSFSVDWSKGNDKLFRFRTGLQNYATSKTLLDSFGPAVKNLAYYGTNTNSEQSVSGKVMKQRRKRSLTLEQEFFLILVRL